MTPIDRRTFLRLVGGTVGGAVVGTSLVGCGTTPPPDGGDPDLPNGYRFHRVKDLGASAGQGGRTLDLAWFYGGTHLTGEGVLTFDARNGAGRSGLFQLGLDFGGERPRIEWERTVVRSGETLADGRVVKRLEAMDVGASGNVAAVVQAAGPSDPTRHYGAGLYLEAGRDGLEPVVTAGDAVGNRLANGHLGDIDLDGADDLLIVLGHAPAGDGIDVGETLLHLPGASLSGARPVLASGEAVPATDHLVSDLGLIDRHASGHFTVQAATEPLNASLAGAQGPATGTAVVSGRLATPGDLRLTAGSNELGAGLHLGELRYGPRIGPGGDPFVILGGEGDAERLVLGDRALLASGDPSPAGGNVLGFAPGAISASGVGYYTLFSEAADGTPSMALVATDGREHRVLLAGGDTLADGTSRVNSFLFGTTTKHVDPLERIVLICDFEDGSTSIVAGVPG
jgi:hypothetical protein